MEARGGLWLRKWWTEPSTSTQPSSLGCLQPNNYSLSLGQAAVASDWSVSKGRSILNAAAFWTATAGWANTILFLAAQALIRSVDGPAERAGVCQAVHARNTHWHIGRTAAEALDACCRPRAAGDSMGSRPAPSIHVAICAQTFWCVENMKWFAMNRNDALTHFQKTMLSRFA